MQIFGFNAIEPPPQMSKTHGLTAYLTLIFTKTNRERFLPGMRRGVWDDPPVKGASQARRKALAQKDRCKDRF